MSSYFEKFQGETGAKHYEQNVYAERSCDAYVWSLPGRNVVGYALGVIRSSRRLETAAFKQSLPRN